MKVSPEYLIQLSHRVNTLHREKGKFIESPSEKGQGNIVNIKPDTPINVYTRFCLNTAKSKFSLISPVADW